MNEQKLTTLFGPMRLPFLFLTPACVLLGLGTTHWITGEIHGGHFILVLVGAICAHISVNAFNEYFDYRSGLDELTKRTPFSGGSGTLPAHPKLLRYALAIAIVTFVIAGLVGIYFVFLRGPFLLALGFLGLLVVVLYTPWMARHPFLCLIAPGLGFGPFMVVGTYLALTGELSWTVGVASLIPFFLVSDLLLLNQFPDVEADRCVGRRHYPILIGTRSSSCIYGLFLLLAYLSIILGVLLDVLPIQSLLGLLSLFLAVPAAVGAYRHANDVEKLLPALGMNVLLIISTPILVSIGLFIA